MEVDQTKPEFLRSKIPEFRRFPPWASQTDLLINDIAEELHERWPVWEGILAPDFDIERDIPSITVSQATQLRRAIAKCRVVSTRDFNY